MSEKTSDLASGLDQSNASGVDVNEKDSVSREAFDRLLGQRKKDQEKLKALEQSLEEREAKEALAREEKLKAEGNYKTLLEDRERELKELQGKLSETSKQVQTFEQTFTDTKKLNAFNKMLGGKIKKDAYYKFVDTSKIALDPETGKVDESSAKGYVKEFVSEYKDLIDFGGKNLPDAAAQRAGFDGEITKKGDFKEAIKSALQRST